MFIQPQHQNRTGPLAQRSTDFRPSGAPAYYLGRPASWWISVLSPARQAQRTHTADGPRHR
jgi:hypothetical protein